MIKFNASGYIENVARNKAREASQNRADYVYKKYMEIGSKLWDDLSRKLPWYEAEIWLRKQFGNEDFNKPSKASCNKAKNSLKPGAELYAYSVKDGFKNILQKYEDFTHGNKSEKNKEIIRKNVAGMCRIFLAVKPMIYDEKRHGKYLPKSEFNSMLGKCSEIISEIG